MRLSRANIPLASEDRSHSQAKSHFTHYNLAPQFWPGLINLQHFCHSRWRNPVRLSKSGNKQYADKNIPNVVFVDLSARSSAHRYNNTVFYYAELTKKRESGKLGA